VSVAHTASLAATSVCNGRAELRRAERSTAEQCGAERAGNQLKIVGDRPSIVHVRLWWPATVVNSDVLS